MPTIDRETDTTLLRNAVAMIPMMPEDPRLALRMLEHLRTLVLKMNEVLDDRHGAADGREAGGAREDWNPQEARNLTKWLWDAANLTDCRQLAEAAVLIEDRLGEGA